MPDQEDEHHGPDQKGIKGIDLSHYRLAPERSREGERQRRRRSRYPVIHQSHGDQAHHHRRQRRKKSGHQVHAVGQVTHRQIAKETADGDIERISKAMWNAPYLCHILKAGDVSPTDAGQECLQVDSEGQQPHARRNQYCGKPTAAHQ